MATAQQVAYEFAQATGKVILIGARPYDKGWFAHCDGIELDGSSPLNAVQGVIDAWVRRTQHEIREAEAKASALQSCLTGLNREVD